MLALHQPRHQHPYPTDSQQLHHDLFTTPSTTTSTTLPLPEHFSQPSPFSLKLLESYLQTPTSSTADDFDLPVDQYMSAYDFQHPAIRIQQSTPVPQLATGYTQSSLALHTRAPQRNWDMYAQNGQLGSGAQLQTPAISRRNRTHQRAPSSSSTGSNSSASTYDSGHATSYTYVGQSENLPSASLTSKVDSSTYNSGSNSRAFSTHLPTPSDTPTQDQFLAPPFTNYSAPNSADGSMAAHFAMKQMLMDQASVADEDAPGFTHSGRHSVSSYDSPATPHTTHNEDYEEKFEVPQADNVNQNAPKFDRTMSDFYQDGLYNPTSGAPTLNTTVSSMPAAGSKLLSPFSTLGQRLHAANHARSHSPSGSMSRGPSPFRQGSPHAPTGNSFGSPRGRLPLTAQGVRQLDKAQADTREIQMQQAIARGRQEDVAPKTISPKDALLEYHETEEDSRVPLFPDGGSGEMDQQYSGSSQYANATQGHFDSSSELNYGLGTNQKDSWPTPNRTNSSQQYSLSSGPSPPQSNFNFVPPSVPGMMQGLSLGGPQYRISNSLPPQQEQTPEFPAHLTSMESSASEAGPETGSAASDFQKPTSSQAETGTYTCTYHGCTLRFETPQKLQRHKREGHRASTVVGQPTQGTTPGVGSGMTSAAILARNSQAGPHKCERTNPTTGKPCNTVFSRPYDLTRHEDTIHNARKQKVRCALCVEEKTFSRNDALTRHMRVVHPEVDFPGKHRRRGGHE